MVTFSRRFSNATKFCLAAAWLTFAHGANAQGVAYVGDEEATSPVADGGGPTLPKLRDAATPRAFGGMQHRAGRPGNNRMAATQSVPREVLTASTDGSAEAAPSSGLRSKFGGFSLSGIFGDDSDEQAAARGNRIVHPGPKRMQRQRVSMAQPAAPAPVVAAPVEQAEKPSRFSLRKLFGGGEEEPAPETGPMMPEGRPEQFQFQQAPEAKPFRADASRAQPMQPRHEMAQASDMQDSEVAPAGYTSRSNGLQLRPTTNQRASLFGGSPNNMSPANQRVMGSPTQPRNGVARMSQNQPNNAFNRGRETMERLTQKNQTPTSASQPVFVSDEPGTGPVSAPGSFRTPPAKPLISSMSPEMPQQQPVATPPSGMVQSEPSPLVIENRSAMGSQARMSMAKNPVPVRAEASPPASTAQPSERVVQLLAEANSFSQTADTEEQLTQVVQMCRHALAIDNSPQAVEYSKNLASWALNRRGELRADAGRDRDAMLDFEDAIHTDPSRWRAVHNRGVMLAQQGKFAAAFDDFNRTLELNPKFAKAYSNRAALYTQAGDLAAALDDYRQAITFDPDLAVAHKGRGRVCHMVGNFEEALQHYDAAVMLAPNDAHMALGRADLLTDMGRYAAAIEGYEHTIAIDPSHGPAYRSLAWVQATCADDAFRNAEQAVVNAEMALQLAGKEDDVTLDTLAAAQANTGDYAAAQATQARALELAPAEDRALYQERLSLYQSNQPFRLEPPQPIRQATYQR